jgi:hypothetical protein
MRPFAITIVSLIAVSSVLALGCAGPNKRLNAPPQGTPMEPSQVQEYFVYMVDNAMLHDMSVADIHFIPHTSEISSLGVRRLNRYCELLKDHGGTLYVESVETDPELVAARISNVAGFLAMSGLTEPHVTVQAGLSAGRKTEASEAIRIKEEGTADDYGTAGGDMTSGY